MKKVFIVFLLLQVINIHLCEEDEEIDAELTAEEAEEFDAALDRADDIQRPDNWCSNKRFKMCRRSYGRCSVWPGMSVGIMLNVSSGCWTNPLESVSLVCVELSLCLDLEFSETK